MIRNPILTRFEELSRLLQPTQRDLHTAFSRPDKLPPFVQDCLLRVSRTLCKQEVH